MRKLILTCLLLVATNTLAQPNIKYGLWELVSESEFSGMPPIRTTQTECLSKEKMIPKQQQPNGECTRNDLLSGNTATFSMVCQGGHGTKTINGEFIYENEELNAYIQTSVAGGTMTAKINGHYIGPCPQQ
jgi:Protein of unknown function (DUF3617)